MIGNVSLDCTLCVFDLVHWLSASPYTVVEYELVPPCVYVYGYVHSVKHYSQLFLNDRREVAHVPAVNATENGLIQMGNHGCRSKYWSCQIFTLERCCTRNLWTSDLWSTVQMHPWPQCSIDQLGFETNAPDVTEHWARLFDSIQGVHTRQESAGSSLTPWK